jgi:hypothetical protein
VLESRADCDGTENSLDLQQKKKRREMRYQCAIADEEISCGCVVYSVSRRRKINLWRNHAVCTSQQLTHCALLPGKVLTREYFSM